MSFLMRLNDSFSQVRGEILLLDPLPIINKVFSLIVQEKRQRKIGSQSAALTDTNTNMAFMVKNASAGQCGGNSNKIQSHGYKGQKKDRPFCTHYNFSGHTIDRYYKLHGYPPGYKQKQQSKPGNEQVSAMVN